MEENKNKSNHQTASNNDEIDLIELFSIVGDKINLIVINIWKLFLNVVLYFYNILNKWKVLIGLAIVIGGVIGYMTKNTSKFYSSKATINSRFLKGVDFTTEVSELNALCTDEGRPMLAKALNIPIKTAEFISEISATGYYKLYKYGAIENSHIADSLLMKSYDTETRFEIVVSSIDPNITKQLIQQGFEYYFNNNVYIKKNLDVYRKNLSIKSDSFVEEKKELQEYNKAYKKIIDSQGDIIQQGKPSRNNPNIVLMSTDQQNDSYIRQSGELAFEAMQKSRRADDSIAVIRQKLSLLQPVEFVNRFSEFYTVSLSAKGKTALGMLVGFICVIAFAILADINSYLKDKANLKN
ncbi:hypothetical protein [Flammeovirga sp. SJP92]|uniref:hypothetical protein n=1 Tax=Flammeovirga sp. SJP92 TaxID=1775430 RepID=UPI0007878E62|nr:hypothetical protein [Flammeovirga sp. SJP92]KXX68580.1 hypothetical protein AVL50_22740 [Flammeovirga sp. SJP92]